MMLSPVVTSLSLVSLYHRLHLLSWSWLPQPRSEWSLR